MAPTDEVVSDTLALLNVVRQAFGQDMLTELPDSHKGNSSDCLYYRALKDVGATSVGGNGGIQFEDPRIAARVASLWGTEAAGTHVAAPPQFGKIISKFDGGELEQYNL